MTWREMTKQTMARVRTASGSAWGWIRRHPRGVMAAALPLLVPVAVVVYYGGWALAFDMERVTLMPATSIIYDRNGYVVQRVFEEHRLVVEDREIPEIMRQAVIATEDQRFYYHAGFDPVGIARALFDNFRGARITSGASTITQQLARNSAGMSERTIDRKLKEIFLAVRIEAAFSKRRILTLYLNRVFFGKHIYGIGAAAESYFGKVPAELTLSECAMLAGILSGPNLFSPWKSPEKAAEARARALDRMARQGYITEETAAAVKKTPLVLRPLIDLPGSHAVDAVLGEIPAYLTREITVKGGLRILTTLDLAFQRAAEEEMEKGLRRVESLPGYPRAARRGGETTPGREPDYLQGAFVALDNRDGGILALVGGRNYAESPFNRATMARRQAGSTLKPFVYAHLFHVGNATALTEVDAAPFRLARPAEAFARPEPARPITIRTALEMSDNYAAMRAVLAAGVEGFAHLAGEAAGTTIPPWPSSALGSCGVTPLELASAYSVFANYGVRYEPHVIRRIETSDGVMIYAHEPSTRRVLSPQVSFQIHDLLVGVVRQGTARSLASVHGIRDEVAGKTGTSDDYKDAWFAGYTRAVTAVVWVGLDRPEMIMRDGYSSRVALPMWAGIMRMALPHYPAAPMDPPEGVFKARRQVEKSHWIFFKKKVAEGPAEYIREEQQTGALMRVTGPLTPEPVREEETGVWARVKRWFGFGQPEKVFEAMPGAEEQPAAGLPEEDLLPRAEPVQDR
jgi:penicillin-binding protein 1A